MSVRNGRASTYCWMIWTCWYCESRRAELGQSTRLSSAAIRVATFVVWAGDRPDCCPGWWAMVAPSVVPIQAEYGCWPPGPESWTIRCQTAAALWKCWRSCCVAAGTGLLTGWCAIPQYYQKRKAYDVSIVIRITLITSSPSFGCKRKETTHQVLGRIKGGGTGRAAGQAGSSGYRIQHSVYLLWSRRFQFRPACLNCFQRRKDGLESRRKLIGGDDEGGNLAGGVGGGFTLVTWWLPQESGCPVEMMGSSSTSRYSPCCDQRSTAAW